MEDLLTTLVLLWIVGFILSASARLLGGKMRSFLIEGALVVLWPLTLALAVASGIMAGIITAFFIAFKTPGILVVLALPLEVKLRELVPHEEPKVA